MTGAELKRIRVALGVSQGAFGAALGYGGGPKARARMVRRLQDGTRRIWPEVASLARWYAQYGLAAEKPPDVLEWLHGRQSDNLGDSQSDNVA
jgi:transcriptional regulator with XRE-family HTH domain